MTIETSDAPGTIRAKRRRLAVIGGLLLTAAAWAGLLAGGVGSAPPGQKQILIVFRYDDSCARSPIELERHIIATFRRNNASLTFGVIPRVCDRVPHDPSPQSQVPLSQAHADMLKIAHQEGVVEVALHGYAHQTVRADRPFTEFSDQEYAAQLDKITKGKAFLETMTGARITCFIPPWNSYDLHTLEALEAAGIPVLSACVPGPVKPGSSLKYLPITCEVPDVMSALKQAKNSSEAVSIIVVSLHPYDFREANSEIGTLTRQTFSELVDQLKLQPQVRMVSIRRATEEVAALGSDRLVLNKRILAASLLLPAFLVGPFEAPYTSYAASDELLRAFRLRTVLYYGSVIVVGVAAAFALGYLFAGWSPAVGRMAGYATAVMTAMVLIYALHDLQVHWKGLTAGALALGGSAGMWLANAGLKRWRVLPQAQAGFSLV